MGRPPSRPSHRAWTPAEEAPQPHPSLRHTILAGWGTAALWALIAVAVLVLLAEAVVLTAHVLGGSRMPVDDALRLGGVLFYWFHHVGVGFRAAGLAVAGMGGGAFSFTLSVALLSGTFVAMWLLHAGGRRVAAAARGSTSVRASQGLKVAVPYAAVCFGLAWLVEGSLTTGSEATPTLRIAIEPSQVGAGLWPLGLGLAAGLAGGLRATLGERSSVNPRDRRVRAALAGGWRMLALGLVLSVVGLLIVAALEPDGARSYGAAVLGTGAGRGVAAVGLHLLALPNIAAYVLFAASGGCIGTWGDPGLCVLSYGSLPSAAAVRSSFEALLAAPAMLPQFGIAPAPYFAFLLVPLVSVVAGGYASAARSHSSSRTQGAMTGALAGVFFGLLAIGLAVLATVTITSGGAPAPAESFRFGPLWSGPLLASAWGIAGGALGGFLPRPNRFDAIR